MHCADKAYRKRAVWLLAAALPADRVLTTRGGHDWGPWRDLLAQFLTRSVFRDRCAR